VTVANNGQEAIDHLRKAPTGFDLVFMDLQMPVMGGYQAATILRSDDRFKKIPIVAMTAHATSEEKQRCMEVGMNAHISKPIDPAALFDLAARFYSSRESAIPAPAEKTENAEKSEKAQTGKATVSSEIPVVEGLESTAALARVAGNKTLYLKLLRQFATQHGSAAHRVTQELAAGDRATAEGTAHHIKGIAANLGARPVQDAADGLEKALRSGADAAQVETHRQRFVTVLTAFVGELATALGEAPAVPVVAAATTVDPKEAREAVAKMRTLLGEFDTAASERFDEQRSLFAWLFSRDELQQFEQHVQGYAFDDALALLDKAAQGKSL
jgi:two-component system, sensor histidine kinase and response regulator